MTTFPAHGTAGIRTIDLTGDLTPQQVNEAIAAVLESYLTPLSMEACRAYFDDALLPFFVGLLVQLHGVDGAVRMLEKAKFDAEASRLVGRTPQGVHLNG